MEYMPALRGEIDDLKPSLFEILSENQLSDLIAPSIRYLLATATHRHPRYLLRALNSFDELYALLGLIIERYYLKTFGGSFTENFYDLKRERVLRTKNGEVVRAQLGAAAPVRESLKLKGVDVWKNLAVIVGIPYLKRKLDESYDIHVAPTAALAAAGGEEEGGASGPRFRPDDSLPPNATLKQRFMHYYKWFLRNVYPSLSAAYYFSTLAFSLAYLFDNTKYSSPFLWLIGTRIRRLGPADHMAIETALNPAANAAAGKTRPGQAWWRRYVSSEALQAPMLKSLKMLLPASIFALKFLEWWHASDFSRQLARKANEALDLPAPVVSGLPTVAKLPKTKKHAKKSSTSSNGSNKEEKKSQSPLPKRTKPPVSAKTYLPIFTVPYPPMSRALLEAPPEADAQSICPICLDTLTNPTACQTGYVFCYTCVFRWMNGDHDRQEQFMGGEAKGEEWDEVDAVLDDGEVKAGGEGSGDESDDGGAGRSKGLAGGSKEGRWESGKGRCPVTGRRVLGGTDGLRRVLI